MNRILIVYISALISFSLAEKVRFDNYTVYRLVPPHDEAVKFFRDLEESAHIHGYNFWSSATSPGKAVDLMVPPHLKEYIENVTKTFDINSTVLTHNVQDNIDNEGFRPESQAGTFGWTSYHTLDEIYDWLRSLPDKHPNVVSLINAGTSYQGRPILGVKVSYNPRKFNTVFVDANIHSREWVTSATLTYILNELLTSREPLTRQIAETHEWYFFPVLNPDGFVFSHTTNRMWRKTRVPYLGGLCFGADPNRNWGYYWNSGGSSNQPCSDTYHGPRAFSEPSTAAVADFLSSISEDLIAYFSFHSYSQMLLMPYGFTTEHLDNYSEVYAYGQKGIQALARRYGTKYVLGNVAETIYVASGSSMDWVKGSFGTKIAFTYELRDTGESGFILPASQIIPNSEETLDSLLTILAEGTPIRSNSTTYSN